MDYQIEKKNYLANGKWTVKRPNIFKFASRVVWCGSITLGPRAHDIFGALAQVHQTDKPMVFILNSFLKGFNVSQSLYDYNSNESWTTTFDNFLKGTPFLIKMNNN